MDPHAALPQAVAVGIGATAVMDLWLLVLKRSGVPTMDFAMLGRWVGHVFHGQVAHEAIRRAQPIAGEVGLGWLTHYAVGIMFAGLLVALQGVSWLDDPAVLPALAWGLATAAAPLLVLQPAMGDGQEGPAVWVAVIGDDHPLEDGPGVLEPARGELRLGRPQDGLSHLRLEPLELRERHVRGAQLLEHSILFVVVRQSSLGHVVP